MITAEAITSPAGIADTVVATRVVLASGLIVADVDTHFAFIPVGTACGTPPSHNALTGEAERAAIRARTAMSAGSNIRTVVDISALHLHSLFSHIRHLPTEVAYTLVAACCVDTVGMNVAFVNINCTFVDVHATQWTFPAGDTRASKARLFVIIQLRQSLVHIWFTGIGGHIFLTYYVFLVNTAARQPLSATTTIHARSN